jgi:hypothetical protein
LILIIIGQRGMLACPAYREETKHVRNFYQRSAR